jgi:hypothetical protein
MVFDLSCFLERHYIKSEKEMVALTDLMNHVRSELDSEEQNLWWKGRLATELRLRGVPVGRAVDRICVALERRPVVVRTGGGDRQPQWEADPRPDPSPRNDDPRAARKLVSERPQ